jgi:hypothetical protein
MLKNTFQIKEHMHLIPVGISPHEICPSLDLIIPIP